MADRKRISTGNPWEKEIGFSRAVRVGNTVYTAGTVAVNTDGVTQGGTCYEQCCYILDKLSRVLRDSGSELAHVVKVTCFLASLDDAPGFSRAHFEYFKDINPATTCVQAAKLFGEGTLVEMELTAVIPS